MYSNGYVGTNDDVQRIRRQEKQREEQRKKFEASKKQTSDRIETAGLRKFAASTQEVVEAAFKNDTVGLASKAEFVQKRQTVAERSEEEKKRKQKELEDLQQQIKEKRRLERESKKPNLSFSMDDGEEEPPEDENVFIKPKVKKAKFGKFGKDPNASTDFLPDRDREHLEQELRQQLEKEWKEDQARLRDEPLEITYSYWDGSGHRRKIAVKKGDTVSRFLKAVREQLAPEFKELRHASVENLLYVKEDLILQHHLCFYDMIVNKARGKSGPLFDFDVKEDVRLLSDASKEKMDSHAGKVVERHWYERNKHIFPASRWEEYDPEKEYGSYTIFG